MKKDNEEILLVACYAPMVYAKTLFWLLLVLNKFSLNFNLWRQRHDTPRRHLTDLHFGLGTNTRKF